MPPFSSTVQDREKDKFKDVGGETAVRVSVAENTGGLATEATLLDVKASLDALETFTDDLETLSTAANALLTTIRDNADQLEGYTDGLESLIGTTNTLLTSVGSYVDGIETLIGTSNTNLIDINAKLSTLPYNKTINAVQGFLNGASSNMTVNGSVTPVNFDMSPASGLTIAVNSISIFIQDKGAPDADKFATITALTNGIRFIAHINSVDYEIANIIDNQNIGMTFSRSPLIPSVGNAWYNDSDLYQGEWIFEKPVKLEQSAGDYLRVVVRDDLSTVDYLKLSAKYYRVIA